MNSWATAQSHRLGLSARAGSIVAAFYGTAIFVLGVWIFFQFEVAARPQPIDEVICVLAVTFAAGCAGFAASRAHGRKRYGWLAMTTAMTSWAIAESFA